MIADSRTEAPQTQDLAICLDNVSKTYSSQAFALEILQSVTVHVRPGMTVGLLGSSGSGKTTLLNIACGFDTPTVGSVSLFGLPVTKLHTPVNVGIVQQRDSLFPHLSARENVMFGIPGMDRRDKQRKQAQAEVWLKRVGLAAFAQSWPKELSGGMRRRVELARAVAHEPDVLFFDEPFSALDSVTKNEMQDLLLELWATSPVASLFATHDVEEALYLSDEILILGGRPGKVVARFRVEFSYPRKPEIRFTPFFTELRAAVTSSLKAHSLEALKGSG